MKVLLGRRPLGKHSINPVSSGLQRKHTKAKTISLNIDFFPRLHKLTCQNEGNSTVSHDNWLIRTSGKSAGESTATIFLRRHEAVQLLEHKHRLQR